MIKSFLTVALFTVSFSALAFTSGTYSGNNETSACAAIIEQNSNSLKVNYLCKDTNGIEISSDGLVSYDFGSYSERIQDEDGNFYTVNGSVSTNELSVAVFADGISNPIWNESLTNLNNTQVKYKLNTVDGSGNVTTLFDVTLNKE